MKTKLTQKQKGLRHLNQIGPINPVQAFFDYSIKRLAAVIYDLKDTGNDIDTTILHTKNKFGEPVHYAQYTLKK